VISRKSSRRFSRFQVRSMMAVAVAGVAAWMPQALRADPFKANNSNLLNSVSSWETFSGGAAAAAPGSGDIAYFDGAWTAPNTGTLSLGGNVSWYGIGFGSGRSNMVAPVTINSGGIITLGAGGILMNGANGNLVTIDAALNLAGTTVTIGSSGAAGANLRLRGTTSNGTMFISGANVSLSGMDNLTQIIASNSGYTTTITGNRTVGTMALYGGDLVMNSVAALGGGGLLLGGGNLINAIGGDMTLDTPLIMGGGVSTVTLGGYNMIVNGTVGSAINSGANTLTLAGGTMTLNGYVNTLYQLNQAGPGTILVTGTSANFNGYNMLGGSLIITPGAIMTVGNVVSRFGTTASGAYLEINGGTLNMNVQGWGAVDVGGRGAIGSQSIMRIKNGVYAGNGQLSVGNDSSLFAALQMDTGTVTVSGANGAGAIAIGGYNGVGILTLSGVALVSGTTNTLYISGGSTINGTGVGIVNVGGGTLATNNIMVGQNGYGILNIYNQAYVNATGSNIEFNTSGDSTPNIYGELNLTGGTLRTQQIQARGDTVTTRPSYINFNGGYLLKFGTHATFLGGSVATNTTIWPGGLALDDGGGNAVINNPLLAPKGYGVASIDVISTPGYEKAAPALMITGGSGFGAAAVALIDASGNWTGVAITNPGQGYTAEDVLTLNAYYNNGSPLAAAATFTMQDNTTLGPGGLTIYGTGGVTMQMTASTYTGPTIINAGTMSLDFSPTNTAITTGIPYSNMLPATALSLNGAGIILNSLGASSTFSRSQAFSSLAVGPGAVSQVVVNSATVSGASAVINVGAITHTSAARLDFNFTDSNNAMTTSNGIVTSMGDGLVGGWATWQANTTNSTWALVSGGVVSGLTTFTNDTFTKAVNDTFSSTANVNLLTAADYTTGAVTTINSLRMNATQGSYVINAAGGLTVTSGGIMLTSMGSNNGTLDTVTINNGTIATGTGQDLSVVQNNTNVNMIINSQLSMGTMGLVKSGAGQLQLNGAASYTGKAAIYGGTLAISDMSDLGTLPGGFVKDQVLLGGALKFLTGGNVGTERGIQLVGHAVIDTDVNNVTTGQITTADTGIWTWNLNKKGSGALTVNADNNNVLGAVTVEAGTLNLIGSMPMSWGTLTIGNASGAGSAAMFILNSGTITPGISGNTNPSLVMGGTRNTVSVLQINSGVANFAQDLRIAVGPTVGDTAASSYGALMINGGTLIHGGTLALARGQTSNNGGSAGVALFEMTNGTLLGTNNNNGLQIGSFQGNNQRQHAVAVLRGGNIVETRNIDVGSSGVGGIANFMGTNATAGTLNLGSSAVVAEVNLNGGMVTTQVRFNGGTTGGGLFNFNGGTLQAKATGGVLMDSAGTTDRVYVWDGGAILDSNGTASTINQAFRTPAANGVNSVSLTSNSGYTSAPTSVTFANGGGFGAAGAATYNGDGTISIIITNQGYGYTSPPDVTLTGGGGAAVPAAQLATLQGVTSVSLSGANFTNSGSYLAPPVVSIYPASGGGQTGPGFGASGYATLKPDGTISSIEITNPGVGYAPITNGAGTFNPTIILTGGGGTASFSTSALSLSTLSSSGGIEKYGAGTITMSASASNFAGPVNVNAGTLFVSGTFSGSGQANVASTAELRVSGQVASSVINVASGGALSLIAPGSANGNISISSGGNFLVAGAGTVNVGGTVSVLGGAVLNMTDSLVTTLNVATLNLGGGTGNAGLKIDLNAGNTTADKIATGTFNATGNTPISLNFVGAPPVNSTFSIATYTTLGGAYTFSNNPSSTMYLDSNSTKYKFTTLTLTGAAGSITINTTGVAPAADMYWTGEFTNTWNGTDAGTLNSNFKGSNLITNASQYPDLTTLVHFNLGTTLPPSTFDVKLDNDGVAKGLILDGEATPVTISNVTGGDKSLFLGSLGITGGASAFGITIGTHVWLMANQTWQNLSTGSPLAVTGAISGTNSLYITAGTISLSGASDYSGGTTLRGTSLVKVGSGTALGTGPLTVSDNSTVDILGNAFSVGILGSDASGVIENNALGGGVLTSNMGANSAATFLGVIKDGPAGGALAVNVNGSTGSLTLGGSLTVSGNIAIGSGRVVTSGVNSLITTPGTLTIGNAANAPAMLTLNDGVLSAGTTAATPSLIVGAGANGQGAFVMNSGIATFNNELYFAYGPNAADSANTSYGAFMMNGGTLVHKSYLGLARGQVANSAGAAYMEMSGGTIDGSASGNPLQFAAFQGTGTLLHAVGVIRGGQIIEQAMSVAGGGAGQLNLLPGANVSANTTTIGSGGIGEVNLNGGILSTQINWGGTAGQILNFNGGTLAARSYDGATLISATNNGRVYLWGAASGTSGGLIIDSHISSATIAESLRSPAYPVVTTVNLDNKGVGYTSAPTVTLSGGGGTGATALVTLDANGQINGYSIVNQGSGYTSAPTVELSGGLSPGGKAGTLTVTLGANSGISGVPVRPNSGGGNRYTNTGYYVQPPIVQILPAFAVVSGVTLTGGGVGATGYGLLNSAGLLTGVQITSPGMGYNSFAYLGTTYNPTVALYGALVNGTCSATQFNALTMASNANFAGGLTLKGGGTITITSSSNTTNFGYIGNTIVSEGQVNLTGTITTSPTWNISALGSVNVNGTAALLTAPVAINVTGGSVIGTGTINTPTLNSQGLVNFAGTLNASTAINILSGGVVNANGVVSTPLVSVSAGGALGGSGSVINGTTGDLVSVVLAAGSSDAARGILNTSDGNDGTLTLGGSLSLGGGATDTSNVQLDIHDRVALSGQVVTAGGGGTLIVVPDGTEFTGETQTVMTYGSINDVNQLKLKTGFLGFTPVTLTVNPTNAVIQLGTVAPAPNTAYFTNVVGDMVWGTVVNGLSSNWSEDESGSIAVTQLPGSNTDVFLTASGASVPDFNFALGQSFIIKGLTVNTSTSPVSVSGATRLTIGADGIKLQGTSPLTINSKLYASADQTWAQGTRSLTINGGLGSNTPVSVVKTGTGGLFLNGDNSKFAGSITMTAGSVTLGNANALGNGTTSFLMAGGATVTNLFMNGYSSRMGDLTGDANATIQNGSVNKFITLSVGGFGNTTFAGTLQNGGTVGNLSLTKVGSGTQTLTGKLSLTGAVISDEGTLIINNGLTTTSTSSTWRVATAAGKSAVMEVDNSALNLGTSNALTVTSTANTAGVLRLNGGTVTMGALDIGLNGQTASTFAAMDMLGNSSVSINSFFAIGNGNYNRAVFNMSGGTVTTVNQNYITISAGGNNAPDQFGVMNVSGGLITTNATNSTVAMYVGENGPGVLNVSGNGNINYNGLTSTGGTITLARQSPGYGVMNLLGGNVTANQVTQGTGVAGIFNFNGGTLTSTANSTVSMMTGLTGAYVWGNNAIIDDGGSNLLLTQSLMAPGTTNGVSSITVGTLATGYIATPVVIISGGGGKGATAVAGIDGSGNLTGVTITNPGVGYTSTPTVAIVGGGVLAGNSSAGVSSIVVSMAANTSSSGGLVKNGTGVLTVAGQNTYTGPTVLNNGVLAVSANANMGVGGAVNFNGGTLRPTSTFTLDDLGLNKRDISVSTNNGTVDTAGKVLTVSGNISGAGSLTILGGGKLNMNGTTSVPINVGGFGNAAFLGGEGVSSAAVTVQNNSGIDLVNSHIGTLTLNGGMTMEASSMRFELGGLDVGQQNITDRVSLGTNTLTLNGNVSVNLTRLGINQGTYTLVSAGAISGSGAFGTLASSTSGTSLLTLISDGTTLKLGVIGKDVPTIAYWSNVLGSNSWSEVSWSSPFDPLLNEVNFATTAAGATNTYQMPGATTSVRFAAVPNSMDPNGASVTTLGTDQVVKEVLIQNNQTGMVSISGNILSIAGGGLTMGTVATTAAGALTINSGVNLLKDQTWTNYSTANAMTVAGIITGQANLSFAGNIAIGGGSPNNFLGNVTVNSGTLTLNGAGALGAATNTLSMGNGSGLYIPNSAQTVGGLNGASGATILGGGTLTVVTTGTGSYAGQITSAMSLVVSGVGTQTLSGANSYTGGTTIDTNATLRNGGATALSPTSAIGGAGRLDMNGFNGSVASLGGNINVTNNGTQSAALTLNNSAATTFSGALNDGTSKLGIVKAGAGDLIFTGTQANTFTGGLTINSAQVWPITSGYGWTAPDYNTQVLSLGGAGNTITLNTGGTIHDLGAGNNGGLLQADWYMPYNFVFAGGNWYHQDGGMPHIGSSGSANATYYTITINGSGSTISSIWNTKLQYVDGYLQGSGSLTISNVGGGSEAWVSFNNTSGALNTFSGLLTIDTYTGNGEHLALGSGNVFANATIDTGTGQKMANAITFNSTTSWGTVLGANGAASIGALQGSGGFSLSDTNTVSGLVEPLTLTVGGKNVSTVYDGSMSGDGNLVLIGGTLAFTNNHTYNGSTTINAGMLSLGNGGTMGSLDPVSAITNNGTLGFNRSDSTAITNTIVGNGVVKQLGYGQTTLSGSVAYTGPTAIANGTLNFAGSGSTIAGVSGSGSMLVSGSLVSDGVNMPDGVLSVTGTHTIRSSASHGAYQQFALGNSAASLSGTSKVAGDTLTVTGTLDIKNNAVVVEAGTVGKTALLTSLAGQLGTSITSSTVASDAKYTLALADNAGLGAATFGGLPVDTKSVIVTEALKGDADLDGGVGPLDLAKWKAGFGVGQYSVTVGDFDHDGGVGPLDLAMWKANFGASVLANPAPSGSSTGGLGTMGAPAFSVGVSAVPEPASLAVLALGAVGLLTRRRRRMQNS
jgi:fibronectin-binding autotransporter adhesin